MDKPRGGMECYKIIYSDIVVTKDIPRIDSADKLRIESVIRTKLVTAPDQFGKPLRRPHKGYWTLRIGNYRVVYSISQNMVRILLILLRDHVYDELTKRINL